MRYNVYLEFWKNIEVDAGTQEEAIENAKMRAINNPFDCFAAEEKIANLLSDRFNENHRVAESE